MPTDVKRSRFTQVAWRGASLGLLNRIAQQIARLSGFFLVALLVLIPLRVSANTDVAKEIISVEGRERIYYDYIPETASPTMAPLMVLLHGSFEDGEYMIGLWKELADREGIVLLAPDALREDGWRPREDSPDYILAVTNAFVANHSIDSHRIYLFGHSGGAEYALTLGVLESQFFAAVAIHAGAWRHRGEFAIAALATRKIPMQIAIGDRDEFFSLDTVRNTETALKSAKIPVEVKIVEGQQHWFNTETKAVIDAMAWDFLKSHTLDGAPQFIVYRHPT